MATSRPFRCYHPFYNSTHISTTYICILEYVPPIHEGKIECWIVMDMSTLHEVGCDNLHLFKNVAQIFRHMSSSKMHTLEHYKVGGPN